MSITYNITTNFGSKDALTTGDPDKIIKGSEFSTEFNAIKTAFTLAAPVSSPTFTGTATIPTAAVTTLNLGGTAITATAEELNYVDGVTSNVQTQLDEKVVKTAAVFDGSIEEQEYALTGTEIDPANGTVQYKTLTENTTFTEVLANGEYVTLMINDGTSASYTVTWPTATWFTVDGSAPNLQATGYTVIELFKVAGVLYGAVVNAA
jgi:hypothetical protein